MKELIESIAEDNETNFCYIVEEGEKSITIRFGLNPKVK